MPRRTRVIVVACALALAIGAPIALGAGAPYGNAAANRQAAQTAAPQLLALLQLPPGTTPAPTGPDGDGVPGYDEATPNLVDAHAWWTSTDSPGEILAYVKAHLPSDATMSGSFSSGKAGQPPTSTGEIWQLPAVRGVLQQRVLVLTLIPTSAGATDVRTDGEAVWLIPRASWERIPAGVQAVTFVLRGTRPDGQPGPASSPRTMRGADARRLTAMINRLAVVQPGTYNCPASLASSVRLRFSARGGRTVAQAIEQPTGCASVALTIGGRRGRALQDDPSVTDDLIRLGAVATCRQGALTASASRPGRDGPRRRRVTEVRVLNRSASACRLRGYPDVDLLGAGGASLRVHVHRLGVTFFRQQGVGANVVLAAGSAAGFTLAWTACHVAPARSVRLALPGGAGGFVVPAPGMIAPCGGRLGVGNLAPLP